METTTGRQAEGRPRKVGLPGERYPLGLRVSWEAKERVDGAARRNGRTQSQEAERLIELGLVFDAQLGGGRLARLFQNLVQIAKDMYPEGDNWLDDPDEYGFVLDAWGEALENFAPYDVDKEIARGRELIAELATADAYLHRRARVVLRQKSRLTRISEEIRSEFAAAAEQPDWDPLPPRPTEAQVRETAERLTMSATQARQLLTLDRAWANDPEVDFGREQPASSDPAAFLRAWLDAKQMLIALHGQEPDEAAIAAYVAGSPELALLGQIETAITTEAVLEHRKRILALAVKFEANASDLFSGPSLADDGDDADQP